MDEAKKTWSRSHDLALIFIALAYGADEDLSAEELATITDILQDWQQNLLADEAQDIVMEAVAVYLDDDHDREVVRSIEVLSEQLSDEERQRALQDVVRIAEADGVLIDAEKYLITRLAAAWNIKGVEKTLSEHLSAGVKHIPGWSLLHDIALMYLVLAHSTDNELSDSEIEAMIGRLNDWQADLSEEAVRKILREALAFYSEEPTSDALQHSVEVIRQQLSTVHRLVLLDDLAFIARADGGVSEQEQELLDMLSNAWNVNIRLNGHIKS